MSVLLGHVHGVQSLAFSRDDELLASGAYDKVIRIWDAQRGVCVRTLSGHTDRVQSLAFSPHDATLASASFDGIGQTVGTVETRANDSQDQAEGFPAEGASENRRSGCFSRLSLAGVSRRA